MKMKEQIEEFSIKEFIKENLISIIIIFVLGIIVYGIKLFTYSFSIDTEALLTNRENLLKSWISISRFGLVFLKKIFDIAYVNLYIANWVGFFLLFISSILCIYNINIITNKNNKVANVLLGGLIVTSPIIVEQFNFTLQCVEVSIALLLLNLAFTIINKSIIRDKIDFKIIFSVIFVVLAFSCYQAFVPLMITLSAFYILLFFKEKDEIKFTILLKFIIIFAIGIVVYKIIGNIVMQITNVKETPYMSSQILWGTQRKIIIIKGIVINIIKILLAKPSLHYNLGMLICVVGFIPVIVKKFNIKNWIFYIAILTFLISPFSLTIFTGGIPAARTMYPITFVTALGAYFLYVYYDSKIIKNIMLVIFSCIILYQMIISILLFYTDYNAFKQQKELANEITSELREKSINDKPITFVGYFSAKGKNIILKGEVMGWTFFEWDRGTKIDSNDRIKGFLKASGYDYEFATKEKYDKAKIIANEMNAYPDEGYIREEDGYVIINLGNP